MAQMINNSIDLEGREGRAEISTKSTKMEKRERRAFLYWIGHNNPPISTNISLINYSSETCRHNVWNNQLINWKYLRLISQFKTKIEIFCSLCLVRYKSISLDIEWLKAQLSPFFSQQSVSSSISESRNLIILQMSFSHF